MSAKNNILDTYRFLRLGLVALGALLLTSVIWQIGDAGCYQASISAFYHTPVHNVFVAALCAVGALMIIYQGDSPVEDVTLNVTGAAAFVIALVPTTVDKHHCASSTVFTSDTDINHGVVNNLFALFIVAVVAVVVARIVNPETFDFSHWTWWEKAWLAVTSLYMLAAAVVFLFERDDFRARTHAHLIAAATLFIGLIIVTIANAVIQWKIKQAKDTGKTYVVLYTALATVMVVSAVALLIAHAILGDSWSRWLFWLELDVIGLFITFWVLQSRALWNWVTPSEQLDATAGGEFPATVDDSLA